MYVCARNVTIHTRIEWFIASHIESNKLETALGNLKNVCNLRKG